MPQRPCARKCLQPEKGAKQTCAAHRHQRAPTVTTPYVRVTAPLPFDPAFVFIDGLLCVMTEPCSSLVPILVEIPLCLRAGVAKSGGRGGRVDHRVFG